MRSRNPRSGRSNELRRRSGKPGRGKEKSDNRVTQMSRLVTTLSGSCCALALVLGAGAAAAEPVKWDFSDEYGSRTEDMTYMAAQYCIAEVEKIAGDDLDITYQGGGALGFKSADHFDAVGDGSVQAAISLLTQFSGVDPLFNLSSIPFVASSPDEAYKLWQIAKPEYAKVFEENGMILLWALPNAPSGIHAKMPITSVGALEGLRIRTYDKNGTDTLKAAGAAPLQIAWADLVPQLSTGGVDAVLTSADGGKGLSVWDYGVKDFTEINYAMALFVAHVNKDAFDALSPKAQAALMDTVDDCDAHSWQIMETARTAPYADMKAQGMTITVDDDVPPEVFKRLGDAADQIKQAWIAQVGPRGEAILAEFEKARN